MFLSQFDKVFQVLHVFYGIFYACLCAQILYHKIRSELKDLLLENLLKEGKSWIIYKINKKSDYFASLEWVVSVVFSSS